MSTKIVHIVPHSHNDLGWVNTVDEYYTGHDTRFQNVTKELTNIILALDENPQRKFPWAEIKFFSMWWNE